MFGSQKDVPTSPIASAKPEQNGVTVIKIDNPDALNDFRSSEPREALFALAAGTEGKRVVVDMGNVDYLSSNGVAVLYGLQRRLGCQQRSFLLVNTSGVVADLINIMKLQSTLRTIGKPGQTLLQDEIVATAAAQGSDRSPG
jgi:anti-anti-sigma factor